MIDYWGINGFYAPIRFIFISVFKGWVTRLRMDWFKVLFGIERHLEQFIRDFIFLMAVL